MATLIHHPCTVALLSTTYWYASLETILLIIVKSQLRQWGIAPNRRCGVETDPSVSETTPVKICAFNICVLHEIILDLQELSKMHVACMPLH